MDITAFVNEWNGKYIDYDGVYGAQCMDLANQYAHEIGAPRFTGNAVDCIDQTNGYWSWEANTPAGVPSPGDVIVWGAMPGNPYGHIAVCVNANDHTFNSFDQNWPENSNCHVQYHGSYQYVAGWLKKPTDTPNPSLQGEDMATNKQGISGDAQFWANAYDERNDQWNHDETVVIPGLNGQIKQLNDQVTSLTAQVQDLGQKLADATQQPVTVTTPTQPTPAPAPEPTPTPTPAPAPAGWFKRLIAWLNKPLFK